MEGDDKDEENKGEDEPNSEAKKKAKSSSKGKGKKGKKKKGGKGGDDVFVEDGIPSGRQHRPVVTFLPDRNTIQRLIKRAADLRVKDKEIPPYEEARPWISLKNEDVMMMDVKDVNPLELFVKSMKGNLF